MGRDISKPLLPFNIEMAGAYVDCVFRAIRNRFWQDIASCPILGIDTQIGTDPIKLNDTNRLDKAAESFSHLAVVPPYEQNGCR